MCGIFGVLVKKESSIDEPRLHTALDCLAHRGLDDAGVLIKKNVGLGHRRLSILDLSGAGHQPMSTPDGRFSIVFNGEIYNFRELRDEYLPDVTLRSTSDTEVLLHLLAKRGIEALPLLRGMFAFAFWDEQEQKMLLARDPFGKKPLYYADTPEAFVFASEPKAILQYSPDLRKPDPTALRKYFLYEYVPAPASGYASIKQVEMGSYMVLDPTGPRQGSGHLPFVRGGNYHSLLPLTKGESPPKLWRRLGEGVNERRMLDQLDQLLSTAVARRLVADVPVGGLLSGGLDSSTILWYVRQQTKAPIHTFSVSFDEQSFDESAYAEQMADSLGTTHHDLKFSLPEFHAALNKILPLLDIPLADASLLPTYAICKLARQYVKVVLDGDGSDELFGGYGTFEAARVAEAIPGWLRHGLIAITPLINSLPASHSYFSLDFKLKSFLKGLSYPFAQRNQIWLGSFSDKELRELLMPEWRKYIANIFDDLLTPTPATGGVEDRVSLLTINQYLQNDILVKLDRASMYASLEARTPFLDVDLAEFALNLPEKFKRNKYILKKLMRGRIPDAIIDRPKQGFALPLASWLAGPLFDWASNILESEKIDRQGILNPRVISRLLAEHHSHQADHRKKIWTLIMFQIWWEKWVQKNVP